MKDDMISRSALIAELEAFKMSLGDIVLRYIVDRVIELVKAHPAVEVTPRRTACSCCKYAGVYAYEEPCSTCLAEGYMHFPKWEPEV